MTSLAERIELIERFSNSRNENGLGFSNGVVSDPDGGYVRHSDYLASARKAEALKQEIAAKEARIAALEEALEPFAMIAGGNYSNQPDGLRIVAGANPYDLRFSFPLSILRRARTLINGGSDAQG